MEREGLKQRKGKSTPETAKPTSAPKPKKNRCVSCLFQFVFVILLSSTIAMSISYYTTKTLFFKKNWRKYIPVMNILIKSLIFLKATRIDIYTGRIGDL